jgi:hypothetical protein
VTKLVRLHRRTRAPSDVMSEVIVVVREAWQLSTIAPHSIHIRLEPSHRTYDKTPAHELHMSRLDAMKLAADIIDTIRSGDETRIQIAERQAKTGGTNKETESG